MSKLPRIPKFEVFRGEDRQWYWRLRAANGEIQCVSEDYPTRSNARRGAKQARRNARFALIEDQY